MTLIGATGFAGLLWLLVVLACPLTMIFMMRGMHAGSHGDSDRGVESEGRRGGGHGCHGATDGAGPGSRATMSLDELKRERDELDALIGERDEEGVA